MENKTGYLREYLHKHGVKPSSIRMVVLDYLLSRRTHPTAEEVYGALCQELPAVSRASIYNTLELFCQKGIVKTVPTDGRETRYDADRSFHGHFECEVCGKIYDFRIDSDNVDLRELEGFVVREKDIYCRGLCPQCHSDQ
ncbi:MAG: transcriptional repressor [Candidatus Atribacteria bacterium]|nr:transcriptional repressor [Candidatus Atribacteria bacterium]